LIDAILEDNMHEVYYFSYIIRLKNYLWCTL